MKTTSLLLLVAAASTSVFALPTDNMPIEKRQQMGNGPSTSSLTRVSATPSVKASSSSGSTRASLSTRSPAAFTSAAASASRTPSNSGPSSGVAKASAAALVNNFLLSADFKAALGNGSTTRASGSPPSGTARSSPKPSAATLKPSAETGRKAFESAPVETDDAVTRKPIPSATALASGTKPAFPSRLVAATNGIAKPTSTLSITYGSAAKCAQVQRVAVQIADMNRMDLPIPAYMAGLEMGLQDIVCP